MTTVTYVRNGGASGTKTMKGLFLVGIAFSLICFTSSFLEKKQLTESKQKLQNTKEELQKLKDMQEDNKSSDLMTDSINKLEPMMALVKEYMGETSDNFLALERLLKKAKETKAFVDKNNEELPEKLKKYDKEIKKYEKIINFFEELHAEL